MAEDPETPDEWQSAVDAADFCLLISAACQYGLITGAPRINVERCQELLERGAELAYFPTPPDRRRAGIARWLRAERESLGTTQRRVAQRSGLSEVRVSQIARAQISCDEATLSRLREAIGAIRKEQHER